MKTIMKDVLRRNRTAILLFMVIELLNLAVFILYGIFTEAFAYSVIVGTVLLLGLLLCDFLRERDAAEKRRRVASMITDEWNRLPEARSLAEEDYQRMIRRLGDELSKAVSDSSAKEQDQMDYYTNWVHQIKTPIAVMKLKLSEDTSENRALSAELFRIEQYVDMVLQYIRLDSSANDLVIREYDLDGLIRETIRKYAGQFIEKNLRIEYEKTEATVVTDRKWFQCILDQLISNAVKYTREGGVKITVVDSVLRISDTGIGIAPEDLPRIFEKGYTGVNGRIGEKSSGLGLYLTKKAADMLAVPIRVESTPGEGTTFVLDLRKK